jgi:hypothetical protein
MTTQVSCTYRVARGGLSDAALLAAVAAVSVQASVGDILSFLGIRVTSDNTSTVGSFAVRTIVFTWLPSIPGAAGPVTIDANNHLNDVPVAAAGTDYVLPPVPLPIGGSPLKTASLRSWLKVVGLASVTVGSGYSAATFATVIGQLAPNKPDARMPKLGLTITGGHISAAPIIDAGAGLVGIPSVLITDPGVTPGSGGSITLSMGVDEIEVAFRGEGYQSAPSIVLVPSFESSFEFSEAKPFFNLMTTAISKAVLSPVSADAPVVT